MLTGVGLNFTDNAAAARRRRSRRSTSGAGCSSSTRRATTSARRRSSATPIAGEGLAEGRGRRRAAVPAAGDRAVHQHEARDLLRRRRAAARARRADGARRSRRPTAPSPRSCARCFSTAPFTRRARTRRRRRWRSSRTRCSSSCRRCGWPTTARRSRTITRRSAGCSSSASRSTAG